MHTFQDNPNHHTAQAVGTAGEKRPEPPKSKAIQRLEAQVAEANRKAAEIQAETDRKASEAQALHAELKRLQLEVDRAQDRITVSDGQAATMRAAVEAMLSDIERRGFGRRDGFGNVLGLPDYSDIVSYERAVSHYDSIRPRLAASLEQAKAALDRFSVDNL